MLTTALHLLWGQVFAAVGGTKGSLEEGRGAPTAGGGDLVAVATGLLAFFGMSAPSISNCRLIGCVGFTGDTCFASAPKESLLVPCEKIAGDGLLKIRVLVCYVCSQASTLTQEKEANHALE